MRATLCLFAYNGLTGGTHLSILGESLVWPELVHRVQGNDALISRARSKVASWFLQEENVGDVLMMIDHDISWQQGDLRHIAEQALEGRAVVAGIYPKRAFGKGFPVIFTDDVEGEYQIGREGLIAARYVSTGFIAIHRAVLEQLASTLPKVNVADEGEEYWPFFLPMLAEQGEDVSYLSEDWAFCVRAREAGFRIYASTRPRLEHEGTHTYRMADARVQIPPKVDIKFKFEPKSALVVAH